MKKSESNTSELRAGQCPTEMMHSWKNLETNNYAVCAILLKSAIPIFNLLQCYKLLDDISIYFSCYHGCKKK